jgi:hypothetical protein
LPTFFNAKTRKGEKTMSIRRCFMGLAVASIFVIGIWLLGSVPQATAETLNFRALNHVTKAEMVPIADVEGHVITLTLREGVAAFENVGLAWIKATVIRDAIKGAGTADLYVTWTFLDGSALTAHAKGMVEATPQGVTSGTKWTGDIIHGVGRFQGIKGTGAWPSRLLPPEKGEPEGKALIEGTIFYTLPSK